MLYFQKPEVFLMVNVWVIAVLIGVFGMAFGYVNMIMFKKENLVYDVGFLGGFVISAVSCILFILFY